MVVMLRLLSCVSLLVSAAVVVVVVPFMIVVNDGGVGRGVVVFFVVGC